MGIGTIALVSAAVIGGLFVVIAKFNQEAYTDLSRRGAQQSRRSLKKNKRAGFGKRHFLFGERAVSPDIPFVRRPLLTKTELEFFRRLQLAFPDVVIGPQVALAAIVDIPEHFNKGKYKYVNRAPFAAKFADFAVIDPDTGEVYAIIELDDHTHDSPESKEDDAARDAMLRKVGIPVHRFDARRMPTADELNSLLGAK